jgi:hypothetical protein
MVVVMVAQRESDVLVDNLLEIVILIRIHYPSTLFVVQMHNLFCVLLHFVVGMLEYFLQNIMSCLDVLKLRFLGNDLVTSNVVHIGFIIVFFLSVLAVALTNRNSTLFQHLRRRLFLGNGKPAQFF